MTEPESPGREGESEGDPTAEDGPDGDAERVETPDGNATDGDRAAETGDARDGDRADDDGEFGDVDDELIERVRERDPEVIAREIATLELEAEGLQAELDAREEEIQELTSKLKRKQADFENYKKRMNERREEEKQRATEGLVERLLSVRDNLQRALDQDGGVDVRDGVESTLRQFDDVLQAENVEPIEPDPAEDVDPHRHEVLALVDADVPEGTIADVHRPGYAMADSVLREAQVTVSEGGGDAEAEARGEHDRNESGDANDGTNAGEG